MSDDEEGDEEKNIGKPVIIVATSLR